VNPGDIGRGPWAVGELAPVLVLAVAFCEALVVIGLLVPLTPLLLALGAGIAAGRSTARFSPG
jgi:membrane protein DedA with SNARE-associated domain